VKQPPNTIEADLGFDGIPHLEARDIIEDAGLEGMEFVRAILGTSLRDSVPDSLRTTWENLVEARNIACAQVLLSHPTLDLLKPVSIPVETARAWVFAHIDPGVVGIGNTPGGSDASTTSL
jgi:hypothetical protein